MKTRWGIAIAVVAAAATLTTFNAPATAHVTVASPYTYTRDVLPILETRCGRCHVDNGVARTLLTYGEAKQRSWPIRQALISGRMPPWPAEGAPVPFKGAQTLTAREFDVLMVWTAGGTPEGTAPKPVTPREPGWPRGAPQAVLTMPTPFTLAAGVNRAEHEVLLAADAIRGRWIRGVDLSPGFSPIVRRADIAITSPAGRRLIGQWVPGDTPQWLEGNAAFEMPQDGALSLRLQYRRPGSADPGPLTDRSSVGFYLSPARATAAVNAIELKGAGEFPFGTDRTFVQSIDRPTRIVALCPVSGPTDAAVQLTVIAPDGRRAPLASLVLRAGWQRRYVFATPVPLGRGDRVEARITPSAGFVWSSLTGDLPIGPAAGGPLELVLEVIQ